MTQHNVGPLAPQAFFMPARSGQRFCLLHPPANGNRAANCVLHVHAFGEEMNNCRRSAARLARRLADPGLAVLQIDLLGCGDSSGDFCETNWEGWQADLQTALAYLQQRYTGKVHLWADRLGALLAMTLVLQHPQQFDVLLLSQPVFDGRQYLEQLKRSLQARAMFARQDARQLDTPVVLEIGGYEIGPALYETISLLQAANWCLPVRQIHWLEMVTEAMPTAAPARVQFFNHWLDIGNPVQLHCVQSGPFWQNPGISAGPDWIKTCATVLNNQP